MVSELCIAKNIEHVVMTRATKYQLDTQQKKWAKEYEGAYEIRPMTDSTRHLNSSRNGQGGVNNYAWNTFINA